MRIKLDENLGRMAVEMLSQAGHDVATIPGERLAGAPDDSVIEVCRSEERCLVTLDLDFANPFLFDPTLFRGIAVLRLPPKATANDLRALLDKLVDGLRRDDIRGKLWVVRPSRIRVFQPAGEDQ